MLPTIPILGKNTGGYGRAEWAERPYADSLLGEGRELLAAGNALGALSLFEEALMYAPEDADALSLKSIALALLGRGADALEAAYKAIAANTNTGAGYSALAAALLSQRRTEEARTELEYALELHPWCGVTRVLAAECWERLGDPVQAREHLRLARQLIGPLSAWAGSAAGLGRY